MLRLVGALAAGWLQMWSRLDEEEEEEEREGGGGGGGGGGIRQGMKDDKAEEEKVRKREGNMKIYRYLRRRSR